MTARHSQRRSMLMPATASRWVMTLLGALTAATSGAGGGPRYEHVMSAALALVFVAAGVVPDRYRLRVRSMVYALATFFIGMAGVTAGVSEVEALTLMSGAVVAGGLSLAFGPPPRRSRHAAL